MHIRAADTGVRVGIAAITMTFAAFASAMVVRQGASPDWLHFRIPPILYLNTVILLASSVTLEWSRARMGDGPAIALPVPSARALHLTLGLGLLFVVGQVLAWRALMAQGLYLSTNPSSAFFYLFTVLHALHLLGGIAALVYVIPRVTRPTRLAPRALSSPAALYWHFMAVLWLCLLLLLVIRV